MITVWLIKRWARLWSEKLVLGMATSAPSKKRTLNWLCNKLTYFHMKKDRKHRLRKNRLGKARSFPFQKCQEPLPQNTHQMKSTDRWSLTGKGKWLKRSASSSPLSPSTVLFLEFQNLTTYQKSCTRQLFARKRPNSNWSRCKKKESLLRKRCTCWKLS